MRSQAISDECHQLFIIYLAILSRLESQNLFAGYYRRIGLASYNMRGRTKILDIESKFYVWDEGTAHMSLHRFV